MAKPFLSGYLAYGLAATSGGFVELAAGNGYARRPIAFSPPVYGRTADLGGGTIGPCTGADYGMVAMGAVFDAAVAGNLLFYFPLPNPAYVAVGGTRTEPSGALAFSFPDLDLPALPRTTVAWPAGAAIGVLDGTALPVTSGVPLTVANGTLAASNLRQVGGSSSIWLPIGFRGRGLPGSGYNETNGANSSFQDVTAWQAPAFGAVKALRLAYGAYDVTYAGEVDRAITVTGTASIQVGTTIYPAKFGGRRQMVVEPMHDVVTSDPINVSIPANTSFLVRTWGQVTGGTSWWLADYASPQSGTTTFLAGEANARGSNLPDHTLATTTPGNSGGGFWPPVAIYALVGTAMPAVLVLGDSIIAGTGDAADASGRMGFAQRAFANAIPWLSLARGSTTAAQAVAVQGRGMYATCVDRGFTDILLQWGRNDLYNGVTATALRQSLLALAVPYQAAGMRVWAFTCPPSTSSTDAWATSANQSVNAAIEPQRQAYNADLRANAVAYGFAGVIDVAAIVEDAANPGLWRTDGGAWTVDGVHPSPIGHLALTSLLSPAMFTL